MLCYNYLKGVGVILKVIICISMIFSFSLLANDEMELKVLKLEKRIKQLEKSNGSNGSGGLKTTDYKKKSVSSNSSSGAAQLSASDQAKLMKQIETIKNSQKEQKKLLDEIMNEE